MGGTCRPVLFRLEPRPYHGSMGDTRTLKLSDRVGLEVGQVRFETPHRAFVVFGVRSDDAVVFEIHEEVFDETKELGYNAAVSKAAAQLMGKVSFIKTQLEIIVNR